MKKLGFANFTRVRAGSGTSLLNVDDDSRLDLAVDAHAVTGPL